MVESKKWKVDKILSLIGSIIYSINPLILFIMGLAVISADSFGGGFVIDDPDLYSYYSDSTTFLQVVGGVILFFALITMGITVFNWIGFIKIDGIKRNGWKIYYLVVGILTTIVGFLLLVTWIGFLFLIPGVLFILAYALGREEKKVIQTEGQPFTNASSQSVPMNPFINDGNQNVSEVGQTVVSSTNETISKVQAPQIPVVGAASESLASIESEEEQWTVSKTGLVSKEKTIEIENSEVVTSESTTVIDSNSFGISEASDNF